MLQMSFNNAWSSRPDLYSPGDKTYVETSVVFHVHRDYVAPDTSLPRVRTETAENHCSSVSTCSQETWRIKVLVTDKDSGLFRVSVKDSRDRDPFWSKENHAIGSREEVEVEAYISCCADGVTIEVEDVADNFIVAYENAEDFKTSGSWDLVIGLPVGIGILVIIAIAVLGGCVYKKKYASVATTDQ